MQPHDALIGHGVLTSTDDGYGVGVRGHAWFTALGFEVDAIRASSRGLAYPCVDWSERRDHFAGPLAVALLDHFIDAHWLTRVPDSRALAVNGRTRRSLDRFLAVPATAV